MSAGQDILKVLESDVLNTFGPALLTFLQAVKANPSPIAEAAAFIKLQGDVIGALPELEVLIVQQITGVLQSKINSALSKAQAAQNAAAPQVMPAEAVQVVQKP